MMRLGGMSSLQELNNGRPQGDSITHAHYDIIQVVVWKTENKTVDQIARKTTHASVIDSLS